jgi:hypothetical protein
MRGLLLLLFCSIPLLASNAQDAQALLNILEGTFVTVDRPDDYKAVLVWKQTIIKHSDLGDNVLLHERSTIRTIDKPYNKQYWVLQISDDGVLLQHFEKESNYSSSSKPLPYMDMKLLQMDDSWIGSVEFENPKYLTRFVESGHRATVKMQVKSDEIIYHLMIFDVNGKQIYGPNEKGYTLKRKQ